MSEPQDVHGIGPYSLVFCRVNQRFGEWVTGQDWAGADSVFVYNTAPAVERLREARKRGLRGVMEQTIAPFESERNLLAEERQRFPAWEPDSPIAPELEQYSEREREEWRLADLVLCGSEFVRDNVVQCGGPSDRCVVVPYGVDNRFEVPNRVSHNGPLRVLTVGAVGLRKGTQYAIQAAQRMQGRAQFRWVGPLTNWLCKGNWATRLNLPCGAAFRSHRTICVGRCVPTAVDRVKDRRLRPMKR